MSKYQELITNNISSPLTIRSILNDQIKSKNYTNAKRVIYELISLTIKNQITTDQFTSIFDALLSQSVFISSYITEILWLTGFIFSSENTEEEIKSYKFIVNYLLSKNIISESNLIQQLEENTLTSAGIVKDMSSFRSHITRINTKTYYEQQKFNLLREETEGFSKLIVLIFGFCGVKAKNDNEIQTIIDKIVCLIGFFDLDPTRVLDIVLEAYQCDPYNDHFLKVFKILNKKALPHVIGFKLKENVNSNIYIIIAKMIQREMITIPDILVHLSPKWDEMEKIYDKNINTIADFCGETLNSKITNELRASNAIYSFDDGNSNNTNTRTANHLCNFEKFVTDAMELLDKKDNQILNLIEGMIKIKDKESTLKMFNVIKNYYDPYQSSSLVKTLCDMISWMIEPLYFTTKGISNNSEVHMEIEKNEEEEKKQFNQIYRKENFFSLSEILKILNIGLSSDQKLFQKILIILTENISYYTSTPQIKREIIKLVKEIFFPSLSLIDPVPALVNLMWKLLSSFSYSERYSLYNEWHLKIYSSHPYLFMKYHVVTKEIGKWQKGLSKENQKQHGKILAIISNPNPVLVFDNIIGQLTFYANQISFFIGSLSSCSQLSLDVITFIICRILSDPTKEKLDKSTCEVALWLKNLAEFIGSFYRKYSNVEIAGVITYIVNRLKKDNLSVEIIVLREIIEKMTGVQTQENVSESTYLSENSGVNLYLATIGNWREIKYLRRSAQSLSKLFTVEDDSPKMALALLVLFNIKRRNIPFESGETSTKLISFLLDQLQLISLQFITFINFYTERSIFYYKLLSNVPPESLIKKYDLSLIGIFQLYRNTIKPIYNQTEEEYKNNIELFKKIFNAHIEAKKNFLSKEFDSMYIQKEKFIKDSYKEIWDYISPEIYYIFNVLDLKDIFYPKEQYEQEIDKLKKEKETIHNNNDEKPTGQNSDNQMMSMGISNTKKRKEERKEIEKINNFIDTLSKESNTIKTHTVQIVSFLKKRGDLLSEIDRQKKRDIPQYFIQYLLYPRLIFSKNDAIYTARILAIFIMLKMPMLNLLDIIQKICKYIIPCILSVTEYEAGNIGIFLNELVKIIRSWQEDKEWNENCNTNPSFSRNLDLIDIAQLSDFKKAFSAILSKMTEMFINIFNNNEDYMNLRNAIEVLKYISFIPMTQENAKDLIDALKVSNQKLQKDDVLIKMYMENLSMNLKNLPSNANRSNEERSNTSKNNIKSDSRGKHSDKSYSNETDKKKRPNRSRDRDDRDRRKDDIGKSSDIRKRSPDYNSTRKGKK